MKAVLFVICALLLTAHGAQCQSEVAPNNVKLQTLYQQFQSFRDDPLFRRYGFTANSPYADWFQKVRVLQNDSLLGPGAKDLADLAISYRLRGGDSDVYRKFLARFEGATLQRFTVLFTGDTQGILFAQPAVPQPVGGITRRLPALEKARNLEVRPVVVDAGDAFASGADDAEAINMVLIRAMNLMRYDAMGLGPADVALGESALRKLAAEARFPLICTNMEIDGAKSRIVPYTVVERDTTKVAVLSLLPDDVAGLNGMRIIPAAQALQTYLPVVRRKADSVIVLTQMEPEAVHKLVDANPNIDVVIGNVETVGKGTMRYQPTPQQGRGYGVVRMEMGSGRFAPVAEETRMMSDEPVDDRITKLLAVLY